MYGSFRALTTDFPVFLNINVLHIYTLPISIVIKSPFEYALHLAQTEKITLKNEPTY